MEWYFCVAIILILSQLLFLWQMWRNHSFVLDKYRRKRLGYRPKTVVIVPCKGIDSDFEKNITSFYKQDYRQYALWFVVEGKSDSAYEVLCRLRDEHADDSKAYEVRILVAGIGNGCSQKIHNQLYCCRQVSEDVEVLAFADSDVCVADYWLSHLVYPLRQDKMGCASGYRWFVPTRNNIATLALSAINAKVAQLLGNTRFNQVWGGSMAIRREVFKELEIEKIWAGALSDDLSVSYAVKKARLKVGFVPACLVASYDSTTWGALIEFARRQFIITRVSAFGTWLFGLFSGLYSVGGLWATAVIAIYAVTIKAEHSVLYSVVPALFFVGQLFRTILRQRMIARLLKNDKKRMRNAAIADMCFFWLWSILLLVLIVSSAFGRTIKWRHIRYRLLSPTETEIIG